MRRIGHAIALATLLAGCAGGEDRDGATSFARPGDDEDGGSFGDEGDSPADDPGGTSGTTPQAGGVTDSSDPNQDPPPDGGTGGAPDPGDGGNDAPPPPPMPPPTEVLPCEAFCMALNVCGLDPDLDGCLASECASTDGGGPCDQSFDQMYACVASQPDCGGVVAWFDSAPGYPCQAQEAQIDLVCG